MSQAGCEAWVVAGVSVALLLLIYSGVTAAVAAVAAWIALIGHFAQTDADRQRRITESFSKAVEQLGSDKLEVRLGGIYSLERISKESPDDLWMVMENLTAFVRVSSRRNAAERLQNLEQRVSQHAYFL
jgi:Flp pilus assembly protein TadB